MHVESDTRTEETEIIFSVLHCTFVSLLCHMLHMYYVPENITKENYGEIFLTIHIATIFLNYLKRKNTLILGSINRERG